KPRLRLSGDQNGPSAPSVPSSARADREFNGRTQSRLVLVESRATNASRRPSGETAEFAGSSSKTIFAGGNTENSAVGGVWLTAARDARKTTSAREKMPTPVRRRRRPRDESRGLRTDSSAAAMDAAPGKRASAEGAMARSITATIARGACGHSLAKEAAGPC